MQWIGKNPIKNIKKQNINKFIIKKAELTTFAIYVIFELSIK